MRAGRGKKERSGGTEGEGEERSLMRVGGQKEKERREVSWERGERRRRRGGKSRERREVSGEKRRSCLCACVYVWGPAYAFLDSCLAVESRVSSEERGEVYSPSWQGDSWRHAWRSELFFLKEKLDCWNKSTKRKKYLSNKELEWRLQYYIYIYIYTFIWFDLIWVLHDYGFLSEILSTVVPSILNAWKSRSSTRSLTKEL